MACKMGRRVRLCEVVLIIFGVVFAVIGTVGIASFSTVFKSLVYENLVFAHNKIDNSLGFTALLFIKPPMINKMEFYFFNITNADEMIYNGEKPRVIETGPFTFMETEEKKYIQFSEDEDRLFYQNYKKWNYDRDLSCDDCDYDRIVTVPNAAQIGAASGIIDPRYGVDGIGRLVISLMLLLLGEQPFNSPSISNLLFDGYTDPLLSIAHSPLLEVLSVVANQGKSIISIPIPAMKTFAYFNGYNNSRDEEYWVRTGKEDVTRLGEVITWAGRNELPQEWWSTKEARMINGSDTGSFAYPNLQKDSVVQMFHSYMCRSFNARYVRQREIEGIHGYTFSVEAEEWDTTLPRNKGFRYKNFEKIRYFKEWPRCPRWNSSNCQARPFDQERIDCALAENICDDCCFQGYSEGTWIMPPGMFPLVCYPGRLQPSPFAVLWSPPHFLFSPKEISSSVVGLNPRRELHEPMLYDHEPFSGSITHVDYRVQVSMPIFHHPDVIQNAHLTDCLLPVFWENSEVHLKQFAYNYYRLGFVFAPTFFPVLFIAFIVVGLILLVAISIRFYVRKR